MANINLPVGVSNFEKIRKDNYFYVDKTGLITDILSQKTEVLLITRPRRFGKTLNMSMLESFFDITKDSKEIFRGLQITREKKLCDEWMNQYPVVSISFKQVDGLNFNDAYNMLVWMISQLYTKHSYLLESKKISDSDKNMINRMINDKPSLVDIKGSLVLLTKLLQQYYDKPVILLIDEYDVPVAKANSKGYYKEMLDVMKAIMQALKDNDSLKFAVITGCLKIAKESIFTGTNNFVSNSITSNSLNEYFGFTQSEVDNLLEIMDFSDRTDDIKEWYDGYHFGKLDVYCPWDVMNYLLELQRDKDAKPISYWKNTSDNAIIRSFIDYAGSNITKKLEILMNGGYIVEQIDENLTYDYLHSSEDNLWSTLYLTGYLTKVKDEDLYEKVNDNKLALKIPNAEIKDIYESIVMKWFNDSAQKWNRKALFDAVWNGDSETITNELSTLLRRTISYHDYREDFYHAFLAGIFTGAGYMVESNKEHGEGRSDVVVNDVIHGRVAIFEAKYAQNLDDLEKMCDKAIEQIDTKMYAKEYEDDYDEILCYGIAFFKKRCMVMKK